MGEFILIKPLFAQIDPKVCSNRAIFAREVRQNSAICASFRRDFGAL